MFAPDEDSPNLPPFLASRQLPVVVVGGGLAGLAASIEAARGGAKVALLEKANKIGGNSAKATSGAVCLGSITVVKAR